MSARALEQAWSALARVALLGTERAGGGGGAGLEPAAVPDPRLQSLLAGLGARSAEARLLAAAAVLAQYRRVGRGPGRAPDPLPPAAPEELAPRCSAAAAVHLRLMLRGEHAQALPEWLQAVAARGVVVREEDLPGLLEAGRSDMLPRERVAAAVGARGRWLATLNSAWAYAAAGEDDEAAWETGTSEARLTALRRIRAQKPARALELLRATWSTEAPPQRLAFLGALQVGLTMADEEFLERALDDRRKEVRAAAAGLLARLPESRLVARLWGRVRPLLRIPAQAGALARALGRARVEVELPTACDPALVRDGIEPKPPRGTGERAWWLAQLVAAVPPALWTRESGAPPEQCIALARGEWREPLLRAWARAAARTADADWGEALLRAWADGERIIEPSPLARALPTERLERVIRPLLESARGEVTAEPGLMLAAEAERTWSSAFTHAVMRRLAHLPATPDAGLRLTLNKLALRLHPATAVAEASALRERGTGGWLDLLHHRHAMLEALDR